MTLKSFKQYLNEEELPTDNNCAIVSAAALADMSEQEIWDRGAKKVWTRRGGIRGADMVLLLERLGLKVQDRTLDIAEPDKNFKRPTWKTVKNRLDNNKKYLVQFPNHFLAVVKGKVVDTACVGNNKRVMTVKEII